MKKIATTVLLAIAVTGFFACKKNSKDEPAQQQQQQPYKCATCSATPDALPANDASSKGVYKGIIIGSTGTVKFSVMNGTNDIQATLVIDGQTVTLTSSVSWTNGQPYVAPFTGTLNGQQVSITFSVKVDGGSPTITASNIPGHPNAVFTLVKETSNALVECYEGTYNTTKPETGTFNIVLSRKLGKWGGIARKDNSSSSEDVSGTVDANGVMTDDKGHTVANLSGEEISGSSKDSDGNTVNVTGKRTL